MRQEIQDIFQLCGLVAVYDHKISTQMAILTRELAASNADRETELRFTRFLSLLIEKMRHNQPVDEHIATWQLVPDLCCHCGKSTAPLQGIFFNRLPTDNGNPDGPTLWACAACAGYPCDACGHQIHLDTEITTSDGGRYHRNCFNTSTHGDERP